MVLVEDVLTMEKCNDINGLINSLNNKNKDVRAATALSLGKMGEPAIEPLIKALEDHDLEVQSNAFKALIEIGNIAVEPLINALKTPNKDVQAYAASILGNIGDIRAVEPLIKVLETPYPYEIDSHPNDPSWDVQAVSAVALGIFGDDRAIKPLKKALTSSNNNLSYYASEAIKKMNIDIESSSKNPPEQDWKEVLKKQKKGKEARRAKLAAAREKIINDKKPILNHINLLIEELNSSNSSKRNDTVNRLVKIGEPAFEPVIAASNKSNAIIRRKICDVLGLMKDPRAINTLLTLLNDPERYVRRRAANALILIGDERAVKPLCKALNDSETKVRVRAAKALGNIGDQSATSSLALHLDDNYAVSKAVSDALNKMGMEGQKALKKHEDEEKLKAAIEQKRRQKELEQRRKEIKSQKNDASVESRGINKMSNKELESLVNNYTQGALWDYNIITNTLSDVLLDSRIHEYDYYLPVYPDFLNHKNIVRQWSDDFTTIRMDVTLAYTNKRISATTILKFNAMSSAFSWLFLAFESLNRIYSYEDNDQKRLEYQTFSRHFERSFSSIENYPTV